MVSFTTRDIIKGLSNKVGVIPRLNPVKKGVGKNEQTCKWQELL